VRRAQPTRVKYIEASLVDVTTANEYDDAPLKEVFWRGSNELRGIYDTLYNKNTPAYQHLDTQLDWNWKYESESRNLLFIDLVTVMPNFRGCQVALFTIYRTIQRLAGDALLVVLDVRPLQFRGNYKQPLKLELDKFNVGYNSAISKLQLYFELMGFHSLLESQYMALNLDYKRPHIGDFCYSSKLEKDASIH